MPRLVENLATDSCTLDDCIEGLDGSGFDANDETSLQHAAGWLARLGRNREFLGDMLIDQLKARHDEEALANSYGPQAIMLSDMRGEYFLRANIWPSESDHVFKTSGARSFVYGTPHDHNFDFLTVGYFGPGYVSDYYEYDHATLAGYRGEKAGLRFVERCALAEGKIMHYRAHRDVHSQLPPESLSVSLNVMAIDPAKGWTDQFGFDLDADKVSGVLNPGSTETFLRMAVALGGQDARDIASEFGKSHPSERLRLASFEARSLLADDVYKRDDVWREAEMSDSRLVAHEATSRRHSIADNQAT